MRGDLTYVAYSVNSYKPIIEKGGAFLRYVDIAAKYF